MVHRHQISVLTSLRQNLAVDRTNPITKDWPISLPLHTSGFAAAGRSRSMSTGWRRSGNNTKQVNYLKAAELMRSSLEETARTTHLCPFLHSILIFVLEVLWISKTYGPRAAQGFCPSSLLSYNPAPSDNLAFCINAGFHLQSTV